MKTLITQIYMVCHLFPFANLGHYKDDVKTDYLSENWAVLKIAISAIINGLI